MKGYNLQQRKELEWAAAIAFVPERNVKVSSKTDSMVTWSLISPEESDKADSLGDENIFSLKIWLQN